VPYCAIYLFLFYLLSANTNLLADDLKSSIDSLVQKQIDEEYNVGAIVGVLRNQDVDFWSYGGVKYGEIDSPDADTLYEIGSISKVFTAIILASLVNEGIVTLDDPISKFIPELSDKSTGNITLQELSTHTSGLPRLPTNLVPQNVLDPYADYTEAKLLDFLMEFPLGNHPTQFSWANYSNVGVGLLGYILTRVTGLSYQDLLYKRITGPLGMKDTVVELSKNQLERFAVPYNSALEETLSWELNVLVGAGGIRSTAKDLLIFARANLYPDETPIGSAIKITHKVIHENANSYIGLGWAIIMSSNKKLIAHNGGTGGFRSYLGFVPEMKTAVVVLTNTAYDIQCVAKIALRNQQCQLNFGFDVSSDLLDQYVGRYQSLQDGEIIISRKKNHLIYEVMGQEKGVLEANTETNFHIQNIAFIEFVKDDNGNVSHMVFKQDDLEVRLDKKD